MSERIHAFGENGELSDGAELAFQHFLNTEVSSAISSAVSSGGGGGEGDSAALVAHIESDTPHPAYDIRLPSLRLIFENGLV